MKITVFKIIVSWVFLIIISINIYAGKSLQYWTNTNNLDILQVEVQKYPVITVHFSGMFRGNPLKMWDDKYLQNIELLENGKSCRILLSGDDSHPPQVFLNIPLYLKTRKNKELSKIQGVFNNFKKFHPTFYVPDQTGFVNVPFRNLYNDIYFQDQRKNIAKKIIDYLTVANQIRDGNFRLHIFIGRFKKINDVELLNHQLSQMPWGAGHWYALFYIDHSKKFPNINRPESLRKCLFIEDFRQDTLLLSKKLSQAVELLQQSYEVFSFRVHDIVPGNTKRQYQLIIPVQNERLIKNFTLELPEDKMQEYFCVVYSEKGRKLLSASRYKMALDTIYQAYMNFPDTSFRNIAQEAIVKWGAKIILDSTGEDILPLLNDAEKKWNFNPFSDNWYKILKLKLLKLHFRIEDTRGAPLAQRITICEEIIRLAPDDKFYQNKLLLLKGEQQKLLGNHWEAVNYFHQSWKIYSDKDAKQEMYRELNQAVSSYFNKGKYGDLLSRVSSYFDYIKQQFRYRYILAFSNLAVHNYSKAKIHYEWLLNHWKAKQKYLTWDKAFNTLQELYDYTLDFDRAFDMIQQIYREKEGENQRLSAVVASLKAKYLVPVIDAFPVFKKQSVSNKLETAFFEELRPLHWPDFVEGLYIISSNGRILWKADKGNIVIPPNTSRLLEIQSFPVFLRNNDKYTAYLINKLTDGYVVLQISTRLNQEEKILLQNIQQNRLNDKPWYQLYTYEQQNGLPVLSEILSLMVGIDYVADGKVNLEAYWRQFKKHSYFIYVVIHNRDGRVVLNKNFNKIKGKFDPLTWERSSRARALFQQEVVYEQESVFDITNPIYYKGKITGAIRFGFKKY